MADTLSSFARKMDVLADRLGGDAALREITTKLGVMAKAEALKAARSDLGGDNRFSGWRKGGVLTTRFNDVSPGAIEFLPTPRARGPYRVAEDGRRAGMSRGTRRRKSRFLGATKGKGTWSDAVKQIEQQMPGKVNAEVVKQLRRTFG